jgi:hypothetical protein
MARHYTFAPSLSRSEGEGWGGVGFAFAAHQITGITTCSSIPGTIPADLHKE